MPCRLCSCPRRTRRRFFRSFCWGLIALEPLVLPAQSLQVSSAKAPRGERVTLEISLNSPPGHEPLGLQWEITFPVKQLTLADGVSPGPAAEAAGKSLRCAAKPEAGGIGGSRCLLIGGGQPIAGGVIARLQFRVLAAARKGAARVRVDQAIAVSKDMQQSPLAAAEATVTIVSR